MAITYASTTKTITSVSSGTGGKARFAHSSATALPVGTWIKHSGFGVSGYNVSQYVSASDTTWYELVVTYSAGASGSAVYTPIITVTSNETESSIYSASVSGGWGACAYDTSDSKPVYDWKDTLLLADGASAKITFTSENVWGDFSYGASGFAGNSVYAINGGEIVVGTTTTSSRKRILDFRKIADNRVVYCTNAGSACLRFGSTGKFTFRGGEIQSHGAILLETGCTATINSKNCRIVNEGNLLDNGSAPQIRVQGVDTAITGVYTCGYVFVPINNPTVPFSGIDGEETDELFTTSSSTPSNVWVPITANIGANITLAYAYYASKWYDLINTLHGLNFTRGGHFVGAYTGNKGLSRSSQDVIFNIPTGATVYLKSTNHGSRLSANQINSNPDFTPIEDYTFTSVAGVASGRIVLGYGYMNVSGASVTRFTDVHVDSHGKYNDTTDRWDTLVVEYGKQPVFSEYVLRSSVLGVAVSFSPSSLPDLGITQTNKATVAGYTGIAHSLSGGVLTTTASSNHILNEIYDSVQNWSADHPEAVWANGGAFVSTSNKLSYTYANFVLAVSGCSVTCAAGQSLPTKPTVGTGGFFEDTDGAIWNTSGTLYYAKHVYRNVKAITGGANVQYAVVACIDDSGNDRTYNTSKALGGLTSDSSGNVEAYFVYKIGSTTYTINEYILAYGYSPYSVPLASTGAPIGSSGAYDIARLVTDSQVTLSRSAALAISGVTVSHSTSTVDLSDETFSVASDNLKARQANTSDIESGIKGYLSYIADGLYITRSDTLYTGKSGWKYLNSVAGGTWKTGVLDLDAAGSYTRIFDACTINFSATGSFDLSDSTFLGAVVLTNSSGGSVTVEVPLGVTYTNTGPNITVIEPQTYQSVTVSGAVAGSRIQIYDITHSTQLYEGTPTFPYTWADGTAYVSDREIRVRCAYVDGDTAANFIEENWGLTTESSPAISRSLSQSNDAIYNANAIDGSTITTVTIVDGDLLVEVDTGSITLQDIYAYETYWLFTSAGIVDEGRFIQAVDTANYKFFDFKIKNVTSPSVPLSITGGWAVDGDSGVAIDLLDTTGGTIFMAGDHVVAKVVSVGGVNVITGDIADVPTASENAVAVWSNATRTLTSSGGITAADVWAHSTRTLTAGTKDAEIDAIKAQTDNLPADTDAALTSISSEIFLTQGMVSDVSDDASKTRKFISNKLVTTDTTYTIYDDDGATVAYSGTRSDTERTPN